MQTPYLVSDHNPPIIRQQSKVRNVGPARRGRQEFCHLLENGNSLPHFLYEVRDTQGKLVKGRLESLNQERAVRQLHDQNYTVVLVVEIRPSWTPIDDLRRVIHRLGYERVGMRDVALFTRQLSLLLEAGVPIVRALEGLRDQVWESPYVNVVCIDILKHVQNGNPLSVSLSKHPRLFSESYISMVRAGEASGSLVEILSRLSSYLESSYSLQQKVKAALVYPLLVFTLSVLMVLFLSSYVFPMFLGFFDGLAMRLPATTRGLIAVASSLGNPWVLAAFGACLPLLSYQFYLLMQVSTIRQQVENFLFGLPVLGDLLRRLASARFCRMAGVLLDCGLAQIHTLDLLGEVVGSVVISTEVETMRATIVGGNSSFGRQLLLTDFFPPICGHMVCAAEESGSMPRIFGRLADFFDDAVSNDITRALALIEPLMLGVMGILIGFVLVSVFQPIYALLDTL